MSLCRAIGYMLQQWKSETVEYKMVKLVRAFFTAGEPGKGPFLGSEEKDRKRD
jgi:hypothetical protein